MDSSPAPSLDEHRLYFASNRPGGCGGGDFYVSRRHYRRDDLGWGDPVHLGCMPEGINSPGGEYTPVIFEDEQGRKIMYFSSNRAVSQSFDLYASVKRHDDNFGPGVPVAEVNSAFTEHGFAGGGTDRNSCLGRTAPVAEVDGWTFGWRLAKAHAMPGRFRFRLPISTVPSPMAGR